MFHIYFALICFLTTLQCLYTYAHLLIECIFSYIIKTDPLFMWYTKLGRETGMHKHV